MLEGNSRQTVNLLLLSSAQFLGGFYRGTVEVCVSVALFINESGTQWVVEIEMSKRNEECNCNFEFNYVNLAPYEKGRVFNCKRNSDCCAKNIGLLLRFNENAHAEKQCLCENRNNKNKSFI